MKRVLIVTEQFPPNNTIASRRFGDMVPFLASHGWEPYVITTKSEGSLPVTLPEESIFRIGDSFVSFETPKDTSKAEPSPLSRFKKKINFYLLVQDRSCFEWLPLIEKEIPKIVSWCKPDFVLGTYPRMAALRAARRIAKYAGVPWGADFRDPATVRQDNRSAWLQWTDRQCEKFLLKDCSLITTVSPTIARHLQSLHKKPVELIYNGYPDELSCSADPQDVAVKPDLYYAGRVYLHQLPALRLLLQTLRYCPERHLTIRLVNADFRSVIESMIVDENLCTRVDVLEITSAEKCDLEKNSSNLNIVLEHIDRSNDIARGILTGKLMELICCTPPVLVIARTDSDIAGVLRETKKGEIAECVLAITRFLQRSSSQLEEEYPGDRNSTKKFSRSHQAYQLASILDNFF